MWDYGLKFKKTLYRSQGFTAGLEARTRWSQIHWTREDFLGDSLSNEIVEKEGTGQDYFANENIVTYNYFFNELLNITSHPGIPDDAIYKIQGK